MTDLTSAASVDGHEFYVKADPGWRDDFTRQGSDQFWLATVEHTAAQLAARFEAAHNPTHSVQSDTDAYADPTGQMADDAASRYERWLGSEQW